MVKKSLQLFYLIKNIKTGKERPLGILKGKATFEINNDFKMTEQELLDS